MKLVLVVEHMSSTRLAKSDVNKSRTSVLERILQVHHLKDRRLVEEDRPFRVGFKSART